MRILWVHYIDLNNDLYSTFPLLIIDSLRKRGHEIQLVVPSIGKNKTVAAGLKGDVVCLPTVRLPLLSILSFYFMSLLRLPGVIKKMPPLLVVVDIFSLPSILIARLYANLKLVVDIRTSFIRETGGMRGYFNKIQYVFLCSLARSVSDRITVTSTALKKEYCRMFRCDPARVKVLTNGVSLDIFDYDKYAKDFKSLREQLNLNGKFVVFYHGSIGPERGLFETMEAISMLAPRYPDIIFFVMGTGFLLNELKSFAEKKSLQNNVRFHGPVRHSEVPKYISISDVAIAAFDPFDYPRESCPLKILEYLAMMKPVITTDIPFNKELTRHGACLYVINSDNAESIEKAIEHVYKNACKFTQGARIGRSVVEKYYTWDEKASDFENFVGDF